MTRVPRASRSDLIEQIERTFTHEAATLTGACVDQSQRHGVALYLVGGALRDLLRGQPGPMREIDLVVEGEVEAIARAAAQASKADLTLFPRFLTARLRLGSATVDLASARRERYPEPAASPVVRPAAIEADLPRRDFSVNAVALALTSARRSELLDPCGGLGDLRARRIRVLHTRSFIHDPARLLRACRYAARLEGTPLPRDDAAAAARRQWIAGPEPGTLRSRVAPTLRGQGRRRRAAAGGGVGLNGGSGAGLATGTAPAACLGATGRQGKTPERALLGPAWPGGGVSPDTARRHALGAATQRATSAGTRPVLATASLTDRGALARPQRSGDVSTGRAGVSDRGCCGPMDGTRGGAGAAVSSRLARCRIAAERRGPRGAGPVRCRARYLARRAPRRRARRGAFKGRQRAEQEASSTKVGAPKSKATGRIESGRTGRRGR